MKATDIILFFAAALVSYLVSGLNPAIILSRAIYHKDIRTCGSGNPGFTNFKRSFGGRYAWFVFLLDIAKGAVLFLAFGLLFRHFRGEWATGVAVSAVFAMLGHAFPVWYGFRGGKGVATLVGAITGIYPPVVLLCFAVWVVILMMTHYVSLASIVAGCCFPVFTIASPKVNQSVPFIVFSFVTAVLLLYTHRKNIVRLKNGTESKIYIWKPHRKADK